MVDAAAEVVETTGEEDTADDVEEGPELVVGDRLSCFVGSLPILVGRKIGRDLDDAPIPLRFPHWAVDAHSIVERINDRGRDALNDLEITCRPTLNPEGEPYQTGDDFEPSETDDLIIVLINTNGGREPDIFEVAMTRGQYDAIDQDLAGWEEAQREDDDEPEPEE